MGLIQLLERILGRLSIQSVLVGHGLDALPSLPDLEAYPIRMVAHRVTQGGVVTWEVSNVISADQMPTRVDSESQWQLVIYANGSDARGEGSPSERAEEPRVDK